MTNAIWALAFAVEELSTGARDGAIPGRTNSSSPAMAEWSDLDVELARRARPVPRLRVLRPIEDKTPEERAMLERLRKTTRKEEDK